MVVSLNLQELWGQRPSPRTCEGSGDFPSIARTPTISWGSREVLSRGIYPSFRWLELHRGLT